MLHTTNDTTHETTHDTTNETRDSTSVAHWWPCGDGGCGVTQDAQLDGGETTDAEALGQACWHPMRSLWLAPQCPADSSECAAGNSDRHWDVPCSALPSTMATLNLPLLAV